MPKKKRRPRKPAARRPERQRPPAGGSLGANVVDYAVEQGVDVSDPAQLAAYMEMYNALPLEERVMISDGLWREDVDDDELDDVLLPPFLDRMPDDETMEGVLAGVDEHALFVDAPLMRRADILMRAIGSRQPFDPEEGFGRTMTLELLGKFGYDAEEDVETTWDAPPVSALVAGLVGGGFLELRDGQLVPSAGVAPWAWPDDAPEERVVVGRILYATTLSAFLEEQDGVSAAIAPPLTAMALMSAVAPDGLHVPEATDEPDGYEDLRLAVRDDLLALEDIGIVTRDGDTFFASPVLITVLPAVIEDLEVTLE
ncbi:hypothetical protein M3148_00470 [Georgenia satyanarayanai]|uniref:hypothetical protein n=1 Tax=Georgenia satyanarayanai TaxID=860221 RepID=UPI00203E269F|nr:hypothetical protein [Georgenia satyanarayanai]MCM3659475.1 hypothetical protein [Georgenia satyanarayanai]